MSNKNPDSIQTFVDYVQQEKNSIYNGAISEDKVKEIAEKHLEREGTLSGLRLQQQSLDLQMRMFENTKARMKNTFIEIENNLDQMIESTPMKYTYAQRNVDRLKNDLEVQYQQPIKESIENAILKTDGSFPIPSFDNVKSTASFVTDKDALITEQAKNLSQDGIYNPPSPWQEALGVDILDSARNIISGIKELPGSYNDWDSFIATDLPYAVQKKAEELTNNFFNSESENTSTSYSGKQKVKINGNYYDKNTVTSFLYNELMDKTFNVLYRNNDGFGDYLSYKETGKTLEERYLEGFNKMRAELVQMRNAAGEQAYNSVNNAAQYGWTNINTKAASRDAEKGYYDDLIDQLDNWKEQTLASGFKSGFSLPNFLTFGIYGLLNDANKIKVLNKLKNGETLSGHDAELARLIELEQTINSMGKEMYGDLRTWSKIGQGLGTTVEIAPQFFITMGATSGIGAGMKYGTKTMVKKFVRNKTWNNATRLAKTFAWDATKFSGVAYARGFAGAPFMPSTYKGYANEYVSQFKFDGNGNFKFEPKNQAAMIAGAWIDGANEIASEFYGGVFDDAISLGSKAFGRATGISKALNRSEVGTWIRRASQSPMSAATKKMLRNAGYTGVISEPLSEVFGDFMSQTMRMMVGADYKFDHFKDADYWLTTMGVSTLYGAPLTSIGAGVNIIREANYAKQLLRTKNNILGQIKDEQLRNTVQLLGNSDNYVNASIELANLDWENFNLEDIASAINYIRYSHVFQATMGDIEGQEQMSAFENTMSDLYKREYTLGEKHTGRIVSAVDKSNNIYSILSGDLQDPATTFTVINEEGQVAEMPASELTIIDLDTIENIMASEYRSMFSSESESARLNSVRYNFESIANPTSKDVERVLSEYGITKPSVGSKIRLVTGEEATVIEDLENGMYKVNTYDSTDGTFKDIEIPFYNIKSDNPITAAAQEKAYKDTITAYEKGDSSEVQKINKSPEEKLDDIINGDYDSRLFDDKGVVKLDEQQIIDNFSLEDPASLEDYISKLGNRVSPQVRQSLNNALKLSKIYNEINPQLAHLVQKSKNRTDVAILSDILSGEIIASDPNITAEELLESIINNSNYNSKIRHDFKNILKALTNAKVQRRTTTKTTTSVTQKDDSNLGEHVLHTDEMDLYIGTPESGTSDISQAVTKEMTEEETIDFSEPTDNTVESKKEDSIPQTPTEQELTIPELEKAFVIPDTDKLIETPSREEEVETLTDEQRREVTIQDSVNPNMREFTVESTLPDDITTDEVIPDRHEVQGNRIYRYDGKQLREERKQVKRTPNRPNDEHDSFYKWLEDTNTDLQGIIDNELSEIAALNPDVKFMMLTEGTKSGYSANSKILNVVFQVVEYTDAIEKIHKESRGGIVTFEGTKYLVIGSTGFKSAPEGVFNPELNHYSFLADIVLKAARNKYTSSTSEVEREAYYVHPSMSTKIKDIQAGWITTQTENDSSVQERSLGELFSDETRNPHGITIDGSKWLIPTKNEAKPITVRVNPEDVVHGLQIPTGLAGAIFLLVPAANGHYIPVSVKIGKTNELADGKLKEAIWETAQQLLDDNPDVRTQCIKDLCKILNLTKEGFNIFINNNDINLEDGTVNSDLVITSKGTPVYSVPLNTLDSVKLYELLFSEIPFQLNIGLQTLTTPSELKMYIESGALKTEAAVLGTVNASYTVHSIDTNLKADPYTEQPTDSQEGSHNNSPLRRGQGNGVIYIGKNQYFRYATDSYIDIKTGTPVTDVLTLKKIEKHLWLEKHKPTPSKVEKSGVKLYILSENEIMTVTKNGDISFITDQERVSSIIKAIQEETDNEVRAVNAKEELSRVEEQQQEEQVVPQRIQEENEASTPEVNFTEDFDAFRDTESTPVEGSFEEVPFEVEEEYTPKEKVSETFTEGVVENVGADQLSTTEFLRDIKKQLIEGGMSKKDASKIMNNIFNKLKEEGLESFYTSADESTIRSIVDIFTHCRNK